jgi:hypothetical protein
MLDKYSFCGDNDLSVSVASQLGGLNGTVRNTAEEDVPIHAAIYPNTIHFSTLNEEEDKKNEDDDCHVYDELNSSYIQKDVVKLLKSSDDKYANAIG